jgi:hypothetical protein
MPQLSKEPRSCAKANILLRCGNAMAPRLDCGRPDSNRRWLRWGPQISVNFMEFGRQAGPEMREILPGADAYLRLSGIRVCAGAEQSLPPNLRRTVKGSAVQAPGLLGLPASPESRTG